MNARVAVLSLFLALRGAAGFTQTATPSITIGTHVLTLGMPESIVLEQLGNDHYLEHLENSTDWAVFEGVGASDVQVGAVGFKNHLLSGAARIWTTGEMIGAPSTESAGKSLFDAIADAIKDLNHGKLESCQLSTAKNAVFTEVVIDCGRKRVSITQNNRTATAGNTPFTQVVENLK
jgi:hypothetical protein